MPLFPLAFIEADGALLAQAAVAGIFVVLLSSLCSLSEAAFLSVPLARARALAKLGGRRAAVMMQIRENVQSAVSAIVILNTIVTVVGPAYVATTAQLAAEEAAGAGEPGTVIVSGVVTAMTILMVLFGEIVPKTLGERFSTQVALNTAFPVRALIVLFHPVVWSTDKVIDRFAPARSRRVTSEEEIAELAEQAHKEGAIRSSEAEVIQRVFRLNDFTAEDIMTPRIRCKMLAEDATLDEVRTDLAQIGYARIPLYAGTRDNVTGVLRRTEALLGLADNLGDTPIKEIASKAKFVPATMTVDRVLLEFQRERVQLGVVVGEYGETVGLVTVEDIMEELVGEILDEKDVDERTIKRLSREEILVHGQTETARINQFFNVDLPEDRPTIAGLLLEEMGRIPEQGEQMHHDGVDIIADQVNDRAIVRVRIRKVPKDRIPESGNTAAAAKPA